MEGNGSSNNGKDVTTTGNAKTAHETNVEILAKMLPPNTMDDTDGNHDIWPADPCNLALVMFVGNDGHGSKDSSGNDNFLRRKNYADDGVPVGEYWQRSCVVLKGMNTPETAKTNVRFTFEARQSGSLVLIRSKLKERRATLLAPWSVLPPLVLRTTTASTSVPTSSRCPAEKYIADAQCSDCPAGRFSEPGQTDCQSVILVDQLTLLGEMAGSVSAVSNQNQMRQ
jgi:hypothetical protein